MAVIPSLQKYFALERAPFQPGADPAFYFSSAGQRQGMSHLSYGLEQGEGMVLISGPAGAGKTTLLKHFAQDLSDKGVDVATWRARSISAGDIPETVLGAFGLEPDTDDASGATEALDSFLTDQLEDGKQCVLLVDEAHELSDEALEALRLLTDLTDAGTALLQVFLFAEPTLTDRLREPALAGLRERVVSSCTLPPLDLDETGLYADHQLVQAGWAEDESLFTDGAISVAHEASGGTPAIVNQLLAGAMTLAAEREMDVVDRSLVQMALAKMQRDGTLAASDENDAGAIAPPDAPTAPAAEDDEAAGLDLALEEDMPEAAASASNVVQFSKQAEQVTDPDDDPAGHVVDSEEETAPPPLEMPSEEPSLANAPDVEAGRLPIIDPGGSAFDRLTSGQRKARSAPPAPAPAASATEPVTLPDAPASLEDVARQITAQLGRNTNREEEEDIELVTSILSGTTPNMDGLKRELELMMETLRRDLDAIHQDVRRANEAIDALRQVQLERRALIDRRLAEIDEALAELRRAR